VRTLRNAFAHDISQLDANLVEIIKKRGDKSKLIRGLCYIQPWSYDEADLIRKYEENGRLLRLGIMQGATVFLYLAYKLELF
jgi:hypothetical protein